MKKNAFLILLMIFSLTITSNQTFASENLIVATATAPKEMPAEVQVLIDRIYEIKAMDKSDLSRAERKVLRKEVRSINKTLRSTNNGVYLSVGAIIIIILLLILIL